MRGVYYRSTGLMEYGDAVYRIMDDKGEKQVYENGDGYFSIDERGDMEWRSGVSDIDGADALLMEKK
ncbi:MAG: hypothetical protein K5696_13125 [Lachnospiraceae bacterium]|nr:hypothetical protein [Lachnospiraceae bacterium]